MPVLVVRSKPLAWAPTPPMSDAGVMRAVTSTTLIQTVGSLPRMAASLIAGAHAAVASYPSRPAPNQPQKAPRVLSFGRVLRPAPAARGPPDARPAWPHPAR